MKTRALKIKKSSGKNAKKEKENTRREGNAKSERKSRKKKKACARMRVPAPLLARMRELATPMQNCTSFLVHVQSIRLLTGHPFSFHIGNA
jgi:hypothetical protein